jgi:hypothetical protein
MRGPGYQVYTVYVGRDIAPVIRTPEQDFEVDFWFMRTDPASQPGHPPMAFNGILLNDRDPEHTVELGIGSAWVAADVLERHHQAFQQARLGPREALARVQTLVGQPIHPVNVSMQLLLAEDVPADLQRDAVWEVALGLNRYWIDAQDGRVLQPQTP